MNRKNFWLMIMFASFILIGVPLATITAIWPSIASKINVSITNIAMVSIAFLIANVITLTLASIVLSKIGSRETIALGITVQAVGLFIMSIANNMSLCIIASTVLGLGSGLVDTTTDYYITYYYKPKYVAWLHCFWGFGSFVGPFIFARILDAGYAYKIGFKFIFPLFLIFAFIVFLSVKIEKQEEKKSDIKIDIKNNEKNQNEEKKSFNFKDIFNIKNVILFLICMFFSDFLQSEISTWYSTYAVSVYNIDEVKAADLVSFFFVGFTFARIISGFIVEKIGIQKIIIISSIIYVCTGILFIMNIQNIYILYVCIVLFGVGVGPLYPFLITYSKEIFPSNLLQGVIGLSGSVSQFGAFCSSAVIGVFVGIFSMKILAFIVFTSGLLTLVSFLVLKRKKIKINKNIKKE